ncbi:hypothetical protein VP01_891g3 [Puccinia sorghi]|uniref:Uncharacterized protein n=1 Tax=Puccinia sorghi TaxID=27349 RepID=A0A0L6U809_9BASI|nr:hypothetical protein VP01_891g3 [Puccinia sorghi]
MTPNGQADRARLFGRTTLARNPFQAPSLRNVWDAAKRCLNQLAKGKSKDAEGGNDAPRETLYQPWITDSTVTGRILPFLWPEMRAQRESKQASGAPVDKKIDLFMDAHDYQLPSSQDLAEVTLAFHDPPTFARKLTTLLQIAPTRKGCPSVLFQPRKSYPYQSPNYPPCLITYNYDPYICLSFTTRAV